MNRHLPFSYLNTESIYVLTPLLDSQIRIKSFPYHNFISGAATLDCKTRTLLQF